MQMLVVIFRQSLDEDIRRLLKGLDINAFPEAPKVFVIRQQGDITIPLRVFVMPPPTSRMTTAQARPRGV
jgi:hypothetical protein